MQRSWQRFQSKRSPGSRQCYVREGAEPGYKRGDEKDPLVAATAKAFELLEIAYYGQRGLMEQGQL